LASFLPFLQKWCQNQDLIPTFNYPNAAPMVLFCLGGMTSKSFDGDKYAVYETSLNLQILDGIREKLITLFPID